MLEEIDSFLGPLGGVRLADDEDIFEPLVIGGRLEEALENSRDLLKFELLFVFGVESE